MPTNVKVVEGRTAAVIGATGLVGSHVLAQLQNDPSFITIGVLVRRPVPFNHPKIRVILLDFADHASFKSAVAGTDALFCAVGTTQKKVHGDRDAYRRVDYDIPIHAAQFCAETGCPHFLLVSSVGASSASRSFYTKLKGEVEDKVKGMGIPSLSIFRPSLLLGDRKESRPAERIAQALMRLYSFLLPSRYKPIAAQDVARAMIAASKRDAPGCHVYHYKEMRDL